MARAGARSPAGALTASLLSYDWQKEEEEKIWQLSYSVRLRHGTPRVDVCVFNCSLLAVSFKSHINAFVVVFSQLRSEKWRSRSEMGRKQESNPDSEYGEWASPVTSEGSTGQPAQII